MMGKRKANGSLLQPCSRKNDALERNQEGNDESARVDSNNSRADRVKNEDERVNFCGIPPAPRSQTTKSGAIFILDKASVVLAHVGKRYQILSSDEQAQYIRRKNMNPNDFRPNIVHEALLRIMDSRLHMAGRLKAIYIRTDDAVLIKVEPNARIPRSLKLFCCMMAELRQKFRIKANGNHATLLRLVENPITKHLPVNSRKIGLSHSSEKAVKIRDYVSGISGGEDIVFVVGAMAHGKIDCGYVDDVVSVSDLHLCAATCLRNICNEIERKWRIH